MRGKCAGVVTDLTSGTSSLFDHIELDSLEATAGQTTQVKLELPYSISGEWGITAKDHYNGLDRCAHKQAPSPEHPHKPTPISEDCTCM